MKENKTLLVKKGSLSEFRKGIIDEETSTLNTQLIELSKAFSGRNQFPLNKEFFYKRELLKEYSTVIFEMPDKAELTEIELISRFTYRIEPYDDLSVKLVLDSTNSERA